MHPLNPLILPLLFLIVTAVLPGLAYSQAQSYPPRTTLINCGSTVGSTINGLNYLPDENFTSAGSAKTLAVENLSSPLLATVRSFPLSPGRKLCYVVPTVRSARYLVRTTYFYGGVNGERFPSPPVFDQVVDGTLWSVVNTTADYRNGVASYYEGVFLSKGKSISLCLGSNRFTESDPFISGLELVILADSVYNSTDFSQNGLSLVARHSFGHNGSSIRYPDDEFDRIWESFGESTAVSTTSTNDNVSVSGIWNLPPLKAFDTELAAGPSGALELNWPPVDLPTPSTSYSYYIALYFTDDQGSRGGSRVFNVSINGVTYYRELSVTQEGVAVFSSNWRLGGPISLSLRPATGSVLPPLVNAGEVFTVLNLGGRTLTRDVMALESIRSSLSNPPLDWRGDPCFPRQYSWTGVKCSGPNETRVRVISLNMTSMGLLGTLSPSIARLTALRDIWLGNNSFSGLIPDLGSLKLLETLHLEDNNFTGPIPTSLGNIKALRELFLQNNNLTGQIPSSLVGKSGLDLRTSGNPLLAPPPP